MSDGSEAYLNAADELRLCEVQCESLRKIIGNAVSVLERPTEAMQGSIPQATWPTIQQLDEFIVKYHAAHAARNNAWYAMSDRDKRLIHLPK